MDQRREEITRRPLYVYDLPQDILTTLLNKSGTGLEPNKNIVDVTSKPDVLQDRQEPGAGGTKACSLCDITFPTVADQRSHVKSDLHLYNLRQKLRGLKPVSEEEFERLIGDLDESLSGSNASESDDGDESAGGRKETTLSALLKKQAAIFEDSMDDVEASSSAKRKRGSGKPPLFWFSTPTLPQNAYLGIYRAIFTIAELENENQIVDTIRKKQLSLQPALKAYPKADNNAPVPAEYKGPHMFLCMIGGGHFAAMIVSLAPRQTKSTATGPLSLEATVIAHKTFHRYTTRRKQGGAQSANDSAKGAAHSAGSSLRRYNEAALTDEVRLLFSEWKCMIDSSELLFIRATGNTNRRTLFGPYDGQALRPNDPRLRGFPFSTRRATQQELMRSFVELTRVKVLEIDVTAIAAAATISEEAERQILISKTAKAPPEVKSQRSEEEDLAILHTTQLQTLIRRSKLPALLSYLNKNNLPADFHFHPRDSPQNYHALTPLHLAASLNSSALVLGLLVKAGADPVLLNGNGKSAYEIAGDRTTRDAFRVARSVLGESRWDWNEGHVHFAMSKAEADERDERERQEIAQKEEERRKEETEKLSKEGPKTLEPAPLSKAAGRMRALALGQLQKSAEEKREEEARGLTPEMRMKLERERRARAAEGRIKRLQDDGL